MNFNAPCQQELYLLSALDLAKASRGFCAPNPSVGAVVVKNNQIVGKGRHRGPGTPHAEVEALTQAGDLAKDADLFVTLEPCCHHGRTPPCVDLIIKCGVSRVFYGMVDPNPLVSGRGEKLLQDAEIESKLISLPEIRAFYQSYHYWWRTQRPYLTLKLAMSLDQKIAGANRKPLQLTGKACQKLTHQWRKQSDALLTTAQTIISDNPQLNVRLDQEIISKPVYIIDRQLKLTPQIKLMQTSSKLIILHQENISLENLKKWEAVGVECRAIPISAAGILDWESILNLIGQHGIHDLWVEAGAVCFQTLWQQSLINHLMLYIAPKVIGLDGISAFSSDMNFSLTETNLEWFQCGADVVMSWRK